MDIICSIIVIAAVAAWWFLAPHDNAAVKEALKQKPYTPEQKQVIRYFLNDGCGAKRMSDQDFDAMLQSTLDKLNLKQRALGKIGLDESELQEIAPISFKGHTYRNAYGRKGQDGRWRTSAYQVTWLFFNASQVFVYQYAFNMDDDKAKESTEEFFYKDITSFSTTTHTDEVRNYDKKAKEMKVEKLENMRFSIVVPGDSLDCAINNNDEEKRSIKGMRAKLREKKGA